MGLNFSKSFKDNVVGLNAGEKKELIPAKFWLNFGYTNQVVTKNAAGEETEEERFIKLPVGIPLDTMAKRSHGNSQSPLYIAEVGASNELLDQLLDAAKTLKPGETKIIGEAANGLQVQIRHVNEAAPEMAAKENPFVRRLDL